MRPARAVVVVVAEAEGVADLVRRELAQPREHHPRQLRRRLVAGAIRRQQALREQVVLPRAQRSERDVALDDLAGARVLDAGAVAPAARGGVQPLDDVVADIERIGALRHQLDAEGVAVAGGFEGLRPPARAVEQRRADRLRRAAIEVVDDRLDGVADRRRRILLAQAVPHDEPLDQRLGHRRREVGPGRPERAGARIERQRLVARLRQPHEGVVLLHGDGRRRRRDVGDAAARQAAAGLVDAVAAAGEREDRVQLGVARERLGPRQVHRAPRRVEAVARRLEAADDVVHVAQDERGRVDEDAAVGFGGGLEAPQHRRRERLRHRPPLVGVVAGRAKRVVRLDQQHLLADPLEAHDVRRAELAAIEADVVRAQAGRQRRVIEQLRVERRDLEPDRAVGTVPVERDEAVLLVESLRLVRDRG